MMVSAGSLIYKSFAIFLLFCVSKTYGGCNSYGHACWGGHGKRSYSLTDPTMLQKTMRDGYASDIENRNFKNQINEDADYLRKAWLSVFGDIIRNALADKGTGHQNSYAKDENNIEERGEVGSEQPKSEQSMNYKLIQMLNPGANKKEILY